MIGVVLKKVFSLHFSSRFLLAYEMISFFFNCLIFIGVSYFVSKENSMNYAGFVLPGLGAMEVMTAALVAPKTYIEYEFHAGTLEQVLLSSRSITHLMAWETLVLLARSFIVCIFYLVIGTILGKAPIQQISGISVACAILLWVQFWCLGLFAAGLSLATRRGHGLNTVIITLACLSGGVYFPVESLPFYFRPIAQINMLAVFSESLRTQIGIERLAIPSLATITTILIGHSLFAYSLNWARKEGRIQA